MAESANAILGDFDATVLPQTEVDDKALNEEKKAAKYSRSSEFKKLREHMESRIEFYQKCLPSGEDVTSSTPTPEDWRVANRLIAEFKQVINFYEEAQEIVASVEKDK